MDLKHKSILLVISGGISAYKSLALIRLIKKAGGRVVSILTQGGAQFVTPLSLSALSEAEVYTDLFSLKDETEMGHIRLAREADLIIAAPASANFIARLAGGQADDLASTCLLAADAPIMIAPAMNPVMWSNPATQDNIATLEKRGFYVLSPDRGEMACGETGEGRLPEPEVLFQAIYDHFYAGKPLAGQRALVTAGPTYEAIDPVRFIGNRSSGKQGFALAEALRDAGADVTLVSGPVALLDPQGVAVVRVESAQEMLEAGLNALPADIAICAAAVSDWTPAHYKDQKIKKNGDAAAPHLELTESPDILKTLSNHETQRPNLVIGFAAETHDINDHAQAKLARKGCDWIVANDVSDGQAFGADHNSVSIFKVGDDGAPVRLQDLSKREIAQRIVSALI